jgi:hypothetical protein
MVPSIDLVDRTGAVSAKAERPAMVPRTGVWDGCMRGVGGSWWLS